ncbi:19057_t:CDS:2, partial [Gigaspora rosea]
MSNAIDLLKELNFKLLAEITELRKENAKIPELRKKFAKIEAENTKLKQAIEENAVLKIRFEELEKKHKTDTTKLTTENIKLKDRVTKLEQIQTLVTISDQNASSIKDKESIISDPIPEPIHSSTQPQEMIHKENVMPTISHKRKKEQGLIQEISAGDSQDDAFLSTQDHVPEILLTQNSNQVSENHVNNITILSVSRSKTLLNLATLYRKACDAEKQAIKANQNEILCWYYYIIEFDNQVKTIIKNEQVGEKKAKGQIYNFIIAQLDTKRNTLHKQTQRARKIYRLFEKIGLDKVKYIKSYSANTISKFTNEQTQTIIDHFTKNSTKEFIDDQDNSSDDLSKTDVGEKTLPKIEVNTLTISQPKLQISAELAQSKAFYAPPKLFPFKRKLSKEMRNPVINKLTSHFTDSPKLDKNCSIDTEGEHQTDSYWVLGPHCPLCRENHMSLYEPGIPYDDVLKAYSDNSELIQELKTRCFTIPIPWNNALILPDKSI